MRGDVRFVQRCRVQHRIDLVHAVMYEVAIDDRADLVRERRGQDVDTEDIVVRVAQAAHQRFAKMAAAAGDEDFHRSVVRVEPRRDKSF